MRALDASLRRLGTDYVDLYQLHSWDADTPIDETLQALDDVVRVGKVRYVGCSNFLAYQLARSIGRAEVLGTANFVSVQPRYNLLFRENERELLPLCAEEGIAVIPYNPLAGGFLSGKHQPGAPTEGGRFTLGRAAGRYQERYWNDRMFKTIDELRPSPRQPESRWPPWPCNGCLANPAITSPIIGASRPEQLADSVAAVDAPLDPDDQGAARPTDVRVPLRRQRPLARELPRVASGGCPRRTDSLLTSIDVTSSKGLELGPLINPVVRREMGDIRYIDHVDTDALRARYATHVGFDVDAIVPIDYVTHGSIYDTVGPDIPFDYVIASHVIEHVPDVDRLARRHSQRAARRRSSVARHPRPPALLRCTPLAVGHRRLRTRPPHEADDSLAAAGLRSLLVGRCLAWVDLVGSGAAVRRARARALRGRSARASDHRFDIGGLRRRALLDVHAVVVHSSLRSVDAIAPRSVLTRVVLGNGRRRVLRDSPASATRRRRRLPPSKVTRGCCRRRRRTPPCAPSSARAGPN